MARVAPCVRAARTLRRIAVTATLAKCWQRHARSPGAAPATSARGRGPELPCPPRRRAPSGNRPGPPGRMAGAPQVQLLQTPRLPPPCGLRVQAMAGSMNIWLEAHVADCSTHDGAYEAQT